MEAGRLEYRQAASWGNPYLRLLRSRLEAYIADELGKEYLTRRKSQTELRKVKKSAGRTVRNARKLQSRRIKVAAS